RSAVTASSRRREPSPTGCRSRRPGPPIWASSTGGIERPPMSRPQSHRSVLYHLIVLLLWGLTLVDAAICRGLFWDGASFLANMLDFGTFHDFYPEREHVAWITQAPVLLLAKAGLRDTRLLAIAFSLALFAWPT